MLIELPTGSVYGAVRGSGRPILILHGGGLDHRHMVDALEPVLERTEGWRRVYIDFPGHGRSTVTDDVTTQDDVLGLISGFIDTVFDGERLAVIGESRGSYHAMALAQTRPDDLLGIMLVVADGMPGDTVDWRPPHQTLVPAPDNVVRDATPEAAARFARLVVQTPDLLRKIETTKVPAAMLADADLAARLTSHFNFSFDFADPAAVLDKPTLIVNGRQDAMAGYQDMMNRLECFPRASFAVLDCAGHSLAWERPELFGALTLDWLVRMENEA